jgi:hypothetical protein
VIKLSTLDPKLRKRIEDQVKHEDETKVHPGSAGVCAVHPQPTQRGPLVGIGEGEAPCWYGTAKRFEITFVVYSTRPCDYDGYDIKAIQDLLVQAEVIPDDKWCVLTGRVCSEKVHTEKEERTEITIITTA